MLLKELEQLRKGQSQVQQLGKGESTFLSQLRSKFKSEVFTALEARSKLHLEQGKTTIARYLKSLELGGYIKTVGGSRHSGYHYLLT